MFERTKCRENCLWVQPLERVAVFFILFFATGTMLEVKVFGMSLVPKYICSKTKMLRRSKESVPTKEVMNVTRSELLIC